MGDDGFRDFVRDQLRDLAGGLEFRRMFGAHGLYLEGVFFAILADGRLYLKTSDATRGQFVSQGMQPFRPSERQTLKTYYEVPAEVLENPAELVKWCRTSVACDKAGHRRR